MPRYSRSAERQEKDTKKRQHGLKKQPGDSGTCAVGRIPERKRVDAFRRPGSIVRALLAERWVRPEIGFAVRAGSEGWEKVLKIDGAFAPRVVVGTLTGASINAAYGSENLYNRAGARWKCTPIPAVRDILLSADRCRGSGSPSRRLRYLPDGRCVYMPPKAAIKWRQQAPYLANRSGD